MKSSIKAIYAAAAFFILIGIAMYIGDSEGAGVPILVAVAASIIATYKHLTDRPGK